MSNFSNERFPSQNIFEIDGVTFSSNFDNGNLAKVEKNVSNGQNHDYKIWVSPDNCGKSYQSKHNAWFHFMISGLPQNCYVRITVENASNHAVLYKQDMVSINDLLLFSYIRYCSAEYTNLTNYIRLSSILLISAPFTNAMHPVINGYD